MEQKKVQRIIGILVVISLVIIVMPLLFGKNFPAQEAANIKAPPFPDQPTTTNLASVSPQAPVVSQTVTTTPVTPTTPASPAVQSNNSVLPTPPILSPQTEKPVADVNNSKNQPSVVTPAIAKKVNEDSSAQTVLPANNEKPAPAVGTVIYEPVASNAPVATSPVLATPNASQKTNEVAPIVITETSVTQTAPVVAKPTPTVVKVRHIHPKMVKAQYTKAKTVAFNKTGSSAWVVQVGNFAIKKNAIHLTNVLNAAGYKAFTHDVKTASGKMNTRVYIGPELKQASAVQLTGEIHQKLNLQAFVVSYKSIKV